MPLMATSTVFLQYRPMKIAFLVKEGDIDALVKVAGINTLLWGGIYNPIIPVSSNNRKYVTQLLKVFNVDVLYKVSDTPEIDAIYKEYPYLRDPSFMGEKIFYEDWHSKKNVLAYLDTSNIINLYWEKEFKDSRKSEKSNCVLIDWDATDKLSSLFSLVFGYFPNTYNLKKNFRVAFLKGLKSHEKKLTSSDNLDKELIKLITPIETTSLELNGSSGCLKEDGIYIGEEDNFTDLINFWNLRASGINIKFLPKNSFAKFKDYIQAHLSILDKIPNRNPSSKESVYVYYQSDPKEISELLRKLHLKNKDFCLSFCSESLWDGLNIRPRSFCFKYERSFANIEKTSDSYNMSFTMPEKKFLTEGFDPQQSLVVEIKSYSDYLYPNHTLTLPYLYQLNEFYSREICFDPDTLRVNQDGISVIIKTNEDHLQLHPIPYEKIIKEIFKLASYKAETNQSGLLTRQIISSMREENSLEACRVFKIKGVRTLLRQLKVDTKIKWSEAKKTIWDKGQFKKYEKLFIEARDKQKLDTQSTINFLIKKNILSPKLIFWHRFFTKRDFKCRNCGLVNEKIKLINYEDNYSCSYCNHKFSMPQYIVEDIQGVVNDYFTFSKSGLFRKNNNQEGAIPVILSLLTLKRVLPNGELFYSTAMNLEGDIKCEIDFCVINIWLNKFEIGIAECKSEGKRDENKEDIDEKDLNNLKHLQDKLNELGMDCYIIISKTSATFKKPELTLIKQLKKENRKFVLFTNKELEPYEPYWELEETENLPIKYPHSMEDMYYNSQYIYLREEKSSTMV